RDAWRVGTAAAGARGEEMSLQPDLLRGELVYLSAVQDADFEVIGDWTENSDFVRLFDSRPAAPRSYADVSAEIRQMQRSENDFIFAVRRCEDELLVGLTGLDGISWTNGTAYLSIG